MAGYTLKLDLSQYERNALVSLLQIEAERNEVNNLTDSPWYRAMVSIREQVANYEEAVRLARETSPVERNTK